MKTIALIDPYQGGHHLAYLRLFSQALLQLNCRVMTFSYEPEGLGEWINCHCPGMVEQFHAFEMRPLQPSSIPLLGRVRSIPGIGPVPQFTGILGKWRQAANTIQAASNQVGYEPDLVFFDWLDSYFNHYLTHHFIDRVFPYSWSGLYFRPGHQRFGRRSLPFLKITLPHHALARSRNCTAVGVVDEWIVDELQRELKTPIVAFPDFTDEAAPDLDYDVVHQIRDQARGRKIIGLVGALSKRKGIVTLLKTALNTQDKDWFFIFVGSLKEKQYHQDYDQQFPEEYQWIRTTAESQPDNCFFHFQRIPDESQFNALIEVCDVVFAAYENFPYSSNVLTKAAAFRKPVVASQGFCMGKRVERYQIGITIPEGNVEGCIEALNHQLIADSSVASELSYDFEGLRSHHCTERLQDSFAKVLELTNVE